jgi:class 3 adenylate cyclase
VRLRRDYDARGDADSGSHPRTRTTREQRSFTAIGDTTNLAARLQALARPGQAVVTASTARRLSHVELEPLGWVEIKGRREPVEIFGLAVQ